MGTAVRGIQLLIAGPHMAETRALHQLLKQQQAIVIVGETLEIFRVPELTRLWKPDLVLLLARGPESAREAIRAILAQVPTTKLLVVANSLGVDDEALILEHGARGVMAAGDAHTQGMRAIRAVHAGEIWGSRTVLSRIAQTAIKHTIHVHSLSKSARNLTERESEIVKLLRSGSSNKEIATQLGISDKTVKTHLQNIFGKLQIRRRQKIFPALLQS